ncbi:MAG: hypothetical protein H0U85_07440, partial [Gemmatimonadales bacterium]|nr:hypothetical protein [Gemmatimonadales bacterium]
MQVGEVTAVAWGGQIGMAASLAEIADRASTWPGLGHRTPGTILLILAPNEDYYRRFTRGRAPAWGAAVAIPDARTILLRADVGDLERTLRHEVAHIVLHDAIRSRVPRWFDEGYASWAAGEWDRLAMLSLNLSVARGDIPELDDLDRALRGGEMGARPAYALATSAVARLAERNPTRTIAPLLERLVRGEDFGGAITATTGLTPGQFSIDWMATVRRRYGFITWAAAGGIWGLIATLVLALGGARRRADASRRAALDDGWEMPANPDLAAEDE